MADETAGLFHLEDDVDSTDVNPNSNHQIMKNEENQWIDELRVALDRECDLGSIRNIVQCRPLIDDLRLRAWKICLGLNEIDHEYQYVDSDTFNLPEQNIIRDDISRLKRTQEISTSKCSDIEVVISYYCKKHKETYEKGNGWIEIFKPLVVLDYKDRAELYALFASIRNRYIPRDCEADGMPYHLFRLLLLYHDPELCSFFDTRKITSDSYAHIWIRSLYAGSCPLNIVLPLWDSYFQYADQFFAFFLALVLLMFAKERLLQMADKEKAEIIDFLSKAPSNLTVEDLDDFCSLANHYASNTPQSFRKEFYSCLFSETDRAFSQKAYSIYQALCLPVSVQELLQANQLGGTAGVRYFIVDCRPADQYNSKHLCTAFHLDANLLLDDPKEFSGTVDALFATQKNAIEAGSAAGGEHLCFMGSGDNEEDKYVRMVVAYFLRQNAKYISIASGGYKILASTIEDPSMLTEEHSPTNKEQSLSIRSVSKQNITEKSQGKHTPTFSLINKISSAVKTKSLEVKDKVKDYIGHTSFTEPSPPIPRHVSKQDKVTKLYRQDQTSVFSLDGDDEVNQSPELVDIETWSSRDDILYNYECEHFDDNNVRHPSLLLVSPTHLFILRKLPDYKTMANLVSTRPLSSITKITSKSKTPEIITFHSTISPENEESNKKSPEKKSSSKDCDKVYIPNASDATKYIKFAIVKALNML